MVMGELSQESEVLVIGAGPGGYAAAFRAADLGMEVTLIDPEQTYIDQDVAIGQDTVIWPNTYIQGNSVIGQDCIIGPNTILREANIGSACWIEQAVIENGSVADGTRVEPFTHMVGGRRRPS